MVTGNMLVMFIVGFIIFCFYLFGLLYSIYWGHNSSRRNDNDPEWGLLQYGLLDVQDKRERYDTQSTNDKKRNDRRRYKTKTRQK